MAGLTRTELRGLARVWRERGLLSGDVNRAQALLLSWLVVEERREVAEVEEDRLRGQIFASNPELYARMFPESGTTEGAWISAEDERGLREAGVW